MKLKHLKFWEESKHGRDKDGRFASSGHAKATAAHYDEHLSKASRRLSGKGNEGARPIALKKLLSGGGGSGGGTRKTAPNPPEPKEPKPKQPKVEPTDAEKLKHLNETILRKERDIERTIKRLEYAKDVGRDHVNPDSLPSALTGNEKTVGKFVSGPSKAEAGWGSYFINSKHHAEAFEKTKTILDKHVHKAAYEAAVHALAQGHFVPHIYHKDIQSGALAHHTVSFSGNTGAPFQAEIHVNKNYIWDEVHDEAHVKSGWLSTRNVLTHEIAHAQHFHKVSDGHTRDPHETLRDWMKIRKSVPKAEAQKVSKYAQTLGTEFVAETYAGIHSGKQYDQDVLTAFEKLMNYRKA